MDKKGSCSTGFSACGGSRKRHSTIPPQCASSRSIFIVWKRSFLYDYTIRMCLGTFSRRGAVASATIYPCAECASSRSISIVWKRSFLYDRNCRSVLCGLSGSFFVVKANIHQKHPENKIHSFQSFRNLPETVPHTQPDKALSMHSAH